MFGRLPTEELKKQIKKLQRDLEVFSTHDEAKLAQYSSFGEKLVEQLKTGEEKRDVRLDLDRYEREIEGQLESVFACLTIVDSIELKSQSMH